MPVVFRHRGFKFFFYSNEGAPREPMHVHVAKDDLEAKFWLLPEVRVAYNDVTTPAPSENCYRWLRRIAPASRGHGMSSSPKPTRVHFDADSLWVDLSDGRTIGVPLAWFPRLLRSTTDERNQVRLSSRGLHWESLDEDISIAGLLAGIGDQTKGEKASAA